MTITYWQRGKTLKNAMRKLRPKIAKHDSTLAPGAYWVVTVTLQVYKQNW